MRVQSSSGPPLFASCGSLLYCLDFVLTAQLSHWTIDKQYVSTAFNDTYKDITWIFREISHTQPINQLTYLHFECDCAFKHLTEFQKMIINWRCRYILKSLQISKHFPNTWWYRVDLRRQWYPSINTMGRRWTCFGANPNLVQLTKYKIQNTQYKLCESAEAISTRELKHVCKWDLQIDVRNCWSNMA